MCRLICFASGWASPLGASRTRKQRTSDLFVKIVLFFEQALQSSKAADNVCSVIIG